MTSPDQYFFISLRRKGVCSSALVVAILWNMAGWKISTKKIQKIFCNSIQLPIMVFTVRCLSKCNWHLTVPFYFEVPCNHSIKSEKQCILCSFVIRGSLLRDVMPLSSATRLTTGNYLSISKNTRTGDLLWWTASMNIIPFYRRVLITNWLLVFKPAV